MANTRTGSANVFATLPFDQIDGVAGFFVHDDFEQAPLLADLVDATGVQYDSGNALYHGNEIAGAAVSNITIPVSVADHVGILRLEAGGTVPADGDAAALQFGGSAVGVQDMYLPDSNGLYVASVIRIADVSDTVAEFGLIGQTPAVPNSSALDVVSLVWDPEDAANVGDEFFIAQVNDAGTDTEVVMDNVDYVENDWVLLEIAVTDTSCSFRVTTEDATETATIADAPVVALRPVWSVENVGAAEEVLDIDLFHMRYLRRSALTANGSDWLGA